MANQPDYQSTQELIRLALQEDLGRGDITTDWIVPPETVARAEVVARQETVVCGLELFGMVFGQLNPQVQVTPVATDGQVVVPDTVVVRVMGPGRAVLTGERTALNLLGRLSGVATMTRRYVQAVAGHPVRLLDTRKTTPLWRAWEKYAVRMGGGSNHRANLGELVLIKDNHLAVAGGVRAAVEAALSHRDDDTQIEVEVETLAQLDEAIAAGADIVLLDNMAPEQLRAAVARADGRVRLEASGGVNLATVAAIAATGIDDISVGALTHSAPVADFSMEITLDRPA